MSVQFAITDCVSHGVRDARADHDDVLLGTLVHGLGVRRNVGRVLLNQRVVRVERRYFLPGRLRLERVWMLRGAESRADICVCSPDSSDGERLYAVLPGADARAHAISVATTHDRRTHTRSDTIAVGCTDTASDHEPVVGTIFCTVAGSDAAA